MRRTRAAHLDDDGTFIESESDIVPFAPVSDTPGSLETIVERILEAVRAGMPNFDCAVF